MSRSCTPVTQHRKFNAFSRAWSDSVRALDPFLAPIWVHQQAPTRGNSCRFASWRRHVTNQKHNIIIAPHDENPLNSHVLALVGGPLWGPKWAPSRHRNPPNSPKHFEFLVFSTKDHMQEQAKVCHVHACSSPNIGNSRPFHVLS